MDLTERVTERLRVRLAIARQVAKTKRDDWDDDGLVFGTAAGNVLDHANVVRRFRALLEKCDLPTTRLTPSPPARRSRT